MPERVELSAVGVLRLTACRFGVQVAKQLHP